jgi:hypothetical protein
MGHLSLKKNFFRFFHKMAPKTILFNKSMDLSIEKALNTSLWGALPFDPYLSESLDRGRPLKLTHPEVSNSQVAQELKKILKNLQNTLAI